MDQRKIKFEPVKGGIHAGGQHAQKNATGVRATYEGTDIVVVIRGRSLAQSKRRAVRAIRNRLEERKGLAVADMKRTRHLDRLHNSRVVRTYHYGRNQVKDHRTKKMYPLDKFMDGKIDLRDV